MFYFVDFEQVTEKKKALRKMSRKDRTNFHPHKLLLYFFRPVFT